MTDRSRGLSPAWALAGLVLLLQLNTLSAFFVGDDFDYLRWSRMGPGGLVHALRLVFWDEWEPAWYFTWYVDEQLWGLNPIGFHLQSALWLVLLVVGLFALVRRILPDEPLVAWSAALLFATNPLHDEAVAYLAARGHVVCGALSVLALWLWLRFRAGDGAPGRRTILLACALLAAALAALAKEIALLLPLWVGALEGAGLAGDGVRRPRRALSAAGLFAVPAALTLGLRAAVVGLQPAKLTGGFERLGGVLSAIATDLPGYALLGALPLPFAFAGESQLVRFRWLGVAVLVLVAVAVVAALALGRRSRPARILQFAIVVSASSLFPVFWADLPLRRRYLFIPSVGIALIAALVLGRIGRRAPRIATILLAALVLAGAAGTVERNDLYRRSGNVAREMLGTIRGVPVGERLPAVPRQRFMLVGLPERYGGDAVSGAYLFHHTDLLSAILVFGVNQGEVGYAMKFLHAEDHAAAVVARNGDTLDVRLSFRTQRAFDEALQNDPAASPRGEFVRARRIDVDPDARTLTYRVALLPEFRRYRATLYLYSDGKLVQVVS